MPESNIPPLEQQPLTFPFMGMQPTLHGLVISIVHSGFHKEEFVIPAVNADAVAIGWILSRSDEVFKALLTERKRQKEEAQIIAETMAKRPMKLV